jgi:hypothetical protein
MSERATFLSAPYGAWPWRSLLCFFRIVPSPHGRDHGLVALEAPDAEGSLAEALNVCLTARPGSAPPT